MVVDNSGAQVMYDFVLENLLNDEGRAVGARDFWTDWRPDTCTVKMISQSGSVSKTLVGDEMREVIFDLKRNGISAGLEQAFGEKLAAEMAEAILNARGARTNPPPFR
jgi:hypothetical protein